MIAWLSFRARRLSTPPRLLVCATWLLLGPATWAQTSDLGAAGPAEAASPTAADPQRVGATDSDHATPFEYGPLQFRPHLRDTYLHGTGILSAPGAPQTTGWHAIAVGLGVDIGTHWRFDYTPTWNVYSNRAFQDVVDHHVFVAGNTVAGGWRLSGTEDYVRTSSPLIETGRQTRQQSSATTLGAFHSLSTNLGLLASVRQDLRFVDRFPDTFNWMLNVGLPYRVGGGLEISPILGVGYDASIKMPATVIERPQLAVKWSPHHKLTLQLQVGQDERRPHAHAPIRSLALTGDLQYRLFEHTALSAGVSRALAPSLFAGQNRRVTLESLGLEQRLLGHFFASVRWKQQTTDFLAVTSDVPAAPRQDSTRMWEFRLQTTVFRRATLALLARSRENRSTLAGFAFRSRQVGFEFAYAY